MVHHTISVHKMMLLLLVLLSLLFFFDMPLKLLEKMKHFPLQEAYSSRLLLSSLSLVCSWFGPIGLLHWSCLLFFG